MTTTTRHPRLFPFLAVASLAVSVVPVGCSNGSDADVTATLKDYSIAAAPTSAAHGDVKIDVKNEGKTEHEFVVFKTDLDEAKLPLTKDGNRVDESGPGITHLDPEAEGVKPGKTKTITINLDPGRYVLVCNLPLHYGKGMHTVLNVT